MKNRLRAAIVGATGMAGQQFVIALSGHPNFEVVQMVTSRNKKTYQEVLLESDGSSRWTQNLDIPQDMKDIPVVSSNEFDPQSVDVIFTAVESDLAKELEPHFAKTTPTFSTASAFRYEQDTPLKIPGVNDKHADMILVQQERRGWKGFVLAIPNCTVTGLAITLQPLYEQFGIERVLMVSMQAVSGAGRSPGVRNLDISDNIVPFIPKEKVKKGTAQDSWTPSWRRNRAGTDRHQLHLHKGECLGRAHGGCVCRFAEASSFGRCESSASRL